MDENEFKNKLDGFKLDGLMDEILNQLVAEITDKDKVEKDKVEFAKKQQANVLKMSFEDVLKTKRKAEKHKDNDHATGHDKEKCEHPECVVFRTYQKMLHEEIKKKGEQYMTAFSVIMDEHVAGKKRTRNEILYNLAMCDQNALHTRDEGIYKVNEGLCEVKAGILGRAASADICRLLLCGKLNEYVVGEGEDK